MCVCVLNVTQTKQKATGNCLTVKQMHRSRIHCQMNTQRKVQYESALLISFMSFPLMQSPLPEHGIIVWEAKILNYSGIACANPALLFYHVAMW